MTHLGYIVEYLRKNGTSYAKRRFLNTNSDMRVFESRREAERVGKVCLDVGRYRVVSIRWYQA